MRIDPGPDWVNQYRFDPNRFTDAQELRDVRAALQAAWLADADHTAVEIAQRYGLYGELCLRCASWETRWVLCAACARHEMRRSVPYRNDRVRAFQQQWNKAHFPERIPVDGIVGPQTLMRGWRPYHTYGLA